METQCGGNPARGAERSEWILCRVSPALRKSQQIRETRLAVEVASLWDASPGDLSQPPCSKIGFWVVALCSLSAWVQHLLREQGQCLSAQAGTFLIELMRQHMDHTVSVDFHAFQAL